MPGAPHESFSKIDIIHRLAKANNWHNYLELCTPSTGNYFADLDRSQFTICHRLMYRCPNDYSDGMTIHFRSPISDISACLNKITNNKLKYDVILVDPWHEYETTYRDLKVSFRLIKRGGALVVHDCFPPNEELANPLALPGAWCGVTYKAFLDFVTNRAGLYYYTVNTDFGCGIIRRLNKLESLIKCFSSFRMQRRPNVFNQWNKLKNDDFSAAFRFLNAHAEDLLRLKSVTEFLEETSHPEQRL